MCKNKVLHHSAKGYAIYCQECQHLQIAFGTTAVRFSENQFEEFYAYLSNFFPQYDIKDQRKAIFLPISHSATFWILNAQELAELRDIFEQVFQQWHKLRLLQMIHWN